MLTPAQLLASLRTPRTVAVRSDGTLIHDLKAKQQKRAQKGFTGGKTPVAVPGYDPPVAFSLAPATLLLCTGVATTPLVSLPVALSSHWAYYRYMWAFDSASPLLQLEASVKDIDFHQKTVLSDELGVGMSHWLMTQVRGAVSHVDVHVAVKTPAIAQQHGFPNASLATRKSPDFIYHFGGGRFGVVECKGNQSGRAQSLDQIVSGLEQVPSLRINNARLAEEYVVATHYSLRGTTVYIVDPPGDDPSSEPGAESERSDEPKGGPRKRRLSAPDAEALADQTDRLQAAKLLAFAGDEQRALDLVDLAEEGDLPPVPEPRAVEFADEATGLDIYGQRVDVTIRGAQAGVRRIEVVQGVATDVLSRLRDGEGAVRALGDGPLAEVFAGTDDRYLVRANGETGAVTALSSDGAVLRIRPT